MTPAHPRRCVVGCFMYWRINTSRKRGERESSLINGLLPATRFAKQFNAIIAIERTTPPPLLLGLSLSLVAVPSHSGERDVASDFFRSAAALIGR